MRQTLFRQKALDALSTPDELERLVSVTDPRSWIALVALAGMVGTALLWGALARVPLEIRGEGLLTQEGSRIVAPTAGLITRVSCRAGETVSPGQVIAFLRSGADEPIGRAEAGDDLRLRPPGRSASRPTGTRLPGPEVALASPAAGTISAIQVREGALVSPGTVVAVIDRPDRRLEARVYVPLADGHRIRPGLGVHLSPATARGEHYGFLVGRVRAVSTAPAGPEALLADLGAGPGYPPERSEGRVPGAMAGRPGAGRPAPSPGDGPLVAVDVELVPDPTTMSGWKWSSRGGPPFRIAGETPCDARVLLGETRPIRMLLP
jgi:HlyD family secretion protein